MVTVSLFLLAASGMHTAAQDGEDQRRAAVLTVTDLSEPRNPDPYQRIITESLTAEIRNAGFVLVPDTDWQLEQDHLEIDSADLVLGPNALAIGSAVAADVVATGFYRVDPERQRILIEVKFYEVSQQRLIGSVIRSGRLGLAVYNTVNSAVLEVISKLKQPLPPLPKAVVRRDQSIRDLTLLSDIEGAEIALAGEPVGTIFDGRLVVPTVTAPIIKVEQSKEGYHPKSQVITLGPLVDTVSLPPLLKASQWGSEVLWTIGQTLGLGLGLRYYPAPDLWYLSFDDYYYVQHTLTDGALPVHHSDARLLVGRYLLRGPEKAFRFGVASGLGGIATWFTIPDQPFYVDLYISPINMFVEWNRDRWALFFRAEGRYSIGFSKGILGRGWLSVGDGPPPLTFGVMRKW